MLEIHEKARLNFDTKGSALVSLIEEIHSDRNNNDPFPSEIHVKQHFAEKDIIEFHPSIITDGFGEEIGFYFFHEKKQYGVRGKNYKTIQKLSESISKQKSFRDKVSEKTIKNIIFKWVQNRCIGSSNQELTSYITSKASAKIIKQEIWIPIKLLQVEVGFKVGHIEFKPISKNMIDTLEAQCIKTKPEKESDIKKLFDDKLRDFQGYAAATLSIEAEPNRAEEIVLEETRKSLLFLRIFNPASFHPRITSYYDIWGSEKVEQAIFLSLQEGRFHSLNNRLLNSCHNFERIDKAMIAEYMGTGLQTLSDLLVCDSSTPFQKAVIDALFIFARCATVENPADKMVYILVALESLFLRNNTESIQQNLAERMAFLIENSVDSRRKLIRDVRNAYGIRSAFVHHGATIDDFEILERFMWHAWRSIIAVISASPSIKRKDDFLDQLDDRKYA